MSIEIKQNNDDFELINPNWTCAMYGDANVKLGVYIKITDLEDLAEDEENPFIFDCYIVPLLGSMTNEGISKLTDTAGFEPTLMDIHCFSGSVCINIDSFYNSNEGNKKNQCVFSDIESVQKYIQSVIVNRLEVIMLNVGYVLDETINKIGTTGWDMLESIINGSDFVKITIDKHK